MLKSIRKNMKAIMWVLLLTFVLWGGSSAVLSRSRTAGYAGTMRGKKIGWKEYERSLLAVENQARLIYGEKYGQLKQYLNLDQEVWDRLLLLREAKKKRIKVSDTETIKKICDMPLFNDSSGKFSASAYKRVMEYYLKVPARRFEEETKDAVRIEKLQDAVVKDVRLSEEQLTAEYKARNEKISADYARVIADNYRQSVGADEKEAAAYYQAHKEEFREPPRVNIEYMPFLYADHKNEPSVTDEQAQAEVEELCGNVYYELAQSDNPPLAAAAKKYGLKLKESGFFAMNEPIEGIGHSYEIASEAFKLQAGRISPPIKTLNGRYIIKLKGKQDAYVPPLKEIQKKATDALIRKKAQEAALQDARRMSDEIKRALAGVPASGAGAAFKKQCEGLKLDVKSTGLFTKNDYIPDIGRARAFAEAASGRGPNETAGVAETPEGAAIIFVTEKTAIDEEKFKKEKSEFKKTLLAEKRMDYFKSYLNDLRRRADIKAADRD